MCSMLYQLVRQGEPILNYIYNIPVGGINLAHT